MVGFRAQMDRWDARIVRGVWEAENSVLGDGWNDRVGRLMTVAKGVSIGGFQVIVVE